MIERYLAELSNELGAVGIGGRLRRRILLETEDHLRSDPDGLPRFGTPAVVAERFADELATVRSRAAANATFLALAVAGIAYAASLFAANRGTDIFAGRLFVLAFPAAVLLVLAPQLAFVAGSLAALRSFRRRAADVMPADEVGLIRRRTAIALGAGWLTVVSLALFAATKGGAEPAWWTPAVLGACGTVAVPLAWATIRLTGAASMRSAAAGPVDDAFDDLGPVVPRPLRGRPWAFCLAVAALAALATFAAGAAGGKPDEGLFNAAAEAVAVCLGFAAFGPSLGLRPSR